MLNLGFTTQEINVKTFILNRKSDREKDFSNKGFWLGCRAILDENGEHSIISRIECNDYASVDELIEIIEEELLEKREDIQSEFSDAIKENCLEEYNRRYGHLFADSDNVNPYDSDPNWEVRRDLESWVKAGNTINDYCQHLALYKGVMDTAVSRLNSDLFEMIVERETWKITEMADDQICLFMQKYIRSGG